ncbi:phosphomannomutase/phosphoglucomutase [Acinetobacter nectaris]|uniref:phosphomannomutase/phosphoglucomutase n=1 Tax=Acinetobacter nectaris TaxID=1219382 RepID=UPI001F38620A|nr:phosphomannomutase/phosphoglucomutase [Acinetobacter nectaris]MCF8999956.1 phosphomannomutase/phosphoglucomutase [Acinetobacter nectaris]MCF9026780.1 phosphomannomutase/phosphoglucomutase [Acinetobacter nectaris]
MIQFKKNQFPRHIFRAYDIRGNLSDLTQGVITAIGHAFVEKLHQADINHIVLGYDARLTSPIYAKIIETILIKHHIQVTVLGCCSTPVMYFSAQKYANGTGIMLTASHNAKEDNGIKWLWKFQPPSPDDIQEIATLAEQYIESHTQPLTIASEIPHCIYGHISKPYVDYLIQDVTLNKPLKIALDGLYGSAGKYAKYVLRELGCEVIDLRCDANGHFPEHAPDPSKEANLTLLKHAIRDHHADVGIALDGDGDRLVLLDEHAQVISPDRLICLLAKICLDRRPNSEVVFDVKCSGLVAKTIHDLGGSPVMLRTGSTFLRKYLMQSNGKAVFGGEYAGHYVFNDGRGLGYDDGIYAALRILEYFTMTANHKFSELFIDYPERYFSEDTYIYTTQYKPLNILSFFDKKMQKKSHQIIRVDGIRVEYPEGSGVLRASNTGDYLTVRFDAESLEAFIDIRNQFASVLMEKYPEIATEMMQIVLS